MAEIKVTELPAIPLEDFTTNDSFIIVDNGKVRRLTREVFYSWMLENVQGEKGEQGVAGRDGTKGSNGTNGTNGTNGLSAYQIATSLGYSGTSQAWLNSLKGTDGVKGANGTNGWSPVFEVESTQGGSFLKVIDWILGTGTKPTSMGYLSPNGIVNSTALATNIKGDIGVKGDIGISGSKGATGIQGERGIQGVDGDSAYAVAVNKGFVGTEEEWLLSLNGATVSPDPENIITKTLEGLFVPVTDPLDMATAIDALEDKNIMTDLQKDKLESLTPQPEAVDIATAIDALEDRNFLTDVQKDKLESIVIPHIPRIIKLYVDKVVDLYSEEEVALVFSKVATGEYTLVGGVDELKDFSVPRIPTDLDGNALFSVTVDFLSDTLTVKTYLRVYDPATGLFSADLTNPVDIPVGVYLPLEVTIEE